MVAADSEGTAQIDASEAEIDELLQKCFHTRVCIGLLTEWCASKFEEDGKTIKCTVQELQTAVSQLSAQDLDRFREGFEEFEAERWDEQFEEDVKSGKLDHLAEQAIADLRAGNCRVL